MLVELRTRLVGGEEKRSDIVPSSPKPDDPLEEEKVGVRGRVRKEDNSENYWLRSTGAGLGL